MVYSSSSGIHVGLIPNTFLPLINRQLVKYCNSRSECPITKTFPIKIQDLNPEILSKWKYKEVDRGAGLSLTDNVGATEALPACCVSRYQIVSPVTPGNDGCIVGDSIDL